MRNYTTQMDAARKGILTPEIETVAKKEHMPVEKLMRLSQKEKLPSVQIKNIPALTRKVSEACSVPRSM